MQTDGYNLAIRLDEFIAAARRDGAACVSADLASGQLGDCAREQAMAQVCPCIQGEACVCAALAEEFEDLARRFRAQADATNVTGRDG